MKLKQTIPIIQDPRKQQTESFKRPNHPDFMDAAELKKIEFTGIRQNNLGLHWEFWILGKVEKTVSFQEVQKDRYALTKAHLELFHMTPEPDLFKR
jgi:hypothetical protein